MSVRTLCAGLVLSLFAISVTADEAPDLSGAALFQKFCAACHGTEAKGDGPVAPYMRVPVPDLTLIAKRNGGSFPADRVRRTIDGQSSDMAHGPRDMPVWGWEFYAKAGEDAVRRRQVTLYLDRLTQYLATLQTR